MRKNIYKKKLFYSKNINPVIYYSKIFYILKIEFFIIKMKYKKK